MRRISLQEVHETGADDEPYVSGFMAHIEPPVELSVPAVERYIRDGKLDATNPEPDAGLVNPLLIGNGDNHTAIYASSEYGYDSAAVKDLFANRVASLLGHLGIESEIV